MRKFKVAATALSVASLVFAFTSCEKEEDIKAKKESSFHVNLSPVSKLDRDHTKMFQYLIDSLDFHEEELTAVKDGFIADGDFFFEKKDFINQPNARHYYKPSRGFYNPSKGNTVYIRFNGYIPSSWKSAFRYAINAWNNEMSNVHFVECQCSGSQVVDIYYINLVAPHNNSYAIAKYPLSGNIGEFVSINSEASYLTSSKKRYVAVHELGHTLGFAHTDHVDPGDSKIPGVGFSCYYGSDAASVMRDNVTSYSGFSSCDKKAIDAVGL